MFSNLNFPYFFITPWSRRCFSVFMCPLQNIFNDVNEQQELEAWPLGQGKTHTHPHMPSQWLPPPPPVPPPDSRRSGVGRAALRRGLRRREALERRLRHGQSPRRPPAFGETGWFCRPLSLCPVPWGSGFDGVESLRVGCGLSHGRAGCLGAPGVEATWRRRSGRVGGIKARRGKMKGRTSSALCCWGRCERTFEGTISLAKFIDVLGQPLGIPGSWLLMKRLDEA